MSTTHHETRTYAGRPACAGSREAAVKTTDRFACSVCGRTDISTGFGDDVPRINTHIHADDLASPATKPQSAPLAPAAEWTPTEAQHEAIKDFFANQSAETFAALLATGLEANTRNPAMSYTRYARRQGWTK